MEINRFASTTDTSKNVFKNTLVNLVTSVLIYLAVVTHKHLFDYKKYMIHFPYSVKYNVSTFLRAFRFFASKR